MREYDYKIRSPVRQGSEIANYVDDLVYARISGNKQAAKGAWRYIEGLGTQDEIKEVRMFFGRRK